MNNIDIRPIRPSDVADINSMRKSTGVFETTLGLPSERIEYNEKFIAGLSDNDHILVAVDCAGQMLRPVVGMVALHVNKLPRKRHSAGIGLMVMASHQRCGIGNLLLGRIIDLADKWLMLHRLELSVFADNKHAIALYERHGFVIEGTKVGSAIKNGVYADELFMGRIKK